MKTVSFLMPTRNRFEWLFKALNSIKKTCRDASDIEILLRVDDDDYERITILPVLQASYPVKPMIGTKGGYLQMGRYFNELTAIADSRWCCMFDDDYEVFGNWHEQLAALQCNATMGPAVNAEFYQLGGSRYSAFDTHIMQGMIMPTAFLKTVQQSTPVDEHWMGLAKLNGWPFHVMRGVTIKHEGRPR